MHDLSLAKPRTLASAGEKDASLVKAARRDPAAFAALYRRYVTPVYRYLYSRVGHAADAEDLTAQVFTETLEGLRRYRERGSFAAWLFTIARRKAADYHRWKHPHLPLNEALDRPAEEKDPLARLVQDEALRWLATLVAQLDEDQQELLRLRFAGGLTYSEIGALTGRSEAAVKMALHRLLRRLQAKWEESDEQAS
jgi:RNA polymerase sigma factor (sigma-70 family)